MPTATITADALQSVNDRLEELSDAMKTHPQKDQESIEDYICRSEVSLAKVREIIESQKGDLIFHVDAASFHIKSNIW